ncbi:ATP synthase subunit I [Zavarzinella formosa]|uniref:ATP synthase subunit I n=1 Tax=Zavarzinella formosa TaxID=360055 RepID=UPI0002D89D10|nr:ATP synthase subunit I [Zavarzinella formosa]
MNESLSLALAWLAGVALGLLFFGGLWWTVRKTISSPRPALWFFGSLLLRTGVTVVGFYFVSGGHWERLLPCLLGFVMARLFMTRLTRPAVRRLIQPVREASHATES